jgi:RNA polymerase sigma-70 factor (ECF subfamily)
MNVKEFYSSYSDKLYRYLSIKLASPSDAEDVLQEILCRLLRYSGRLKLVRNPAAFAYRVARNEANRFLRRKIRSEEGCRQMHPIPEIIQSSISGPDKTSEKLVSEALAELPAEQREVIVLKIFEDFTFKQIASICRISTNTAASRYRYGLEKLRSFLEGKI